MKAILLGSLLATTLAGIAHAQVPAPEPMLAPSFRASELLPSEILKSDLHRIREHCPSDGFMINFSIDTNYGELECHGMNALAETINELRAIKTLATTSHSDAFAQAVADSSYGSGAGPNQLDAPKLPKLSVSHFFQSAGAEITKTPSVSGATKTQGASAKSKEKYVPKGEWIQTKLSIAKQLGVNPYSRNVILQNQLDKVSWVIHNSPTKVELEQGNISKKMATLMNAQHTTGLPASVYKKSPAQLLIADRDSLLKMGAPEPLIDAILLNIDLSPSLRHSMIEALKQLPAQGDRINILGIAADCTSAEQARYLNQVLVKLAAQHKRSPYRALTTVAKMPAGITAGGTLDVVAPADYITWNPRLIAFLTTPKQPGLKYRARIFGKLSPAAKEGFARTGWEVISQ